MRKNFAFTLAELLIVIGVIGVVAALTLPSLNNSTGDKKTVARVQKLYSDLSDGYGRARAVHGPLNGWFINDKLNSDLNSSSNISSNQATITKRIANRITENFKIVSQCESTDLEPCWNPHKKDFMGHDPGFYDTETEKYTKYWNCESNSFGMVLADGSSMAIRHYYDGNLNNKFLICADVDGPYQGPNVWGKDLFIYWFDNDEGILPGGYDNQGDDLPCGGMNATCTAWVIQKGNMDYLKTSDGKTCPNGKVLSWRGNSSCK